MEREIIDYLKAIPVSLEDLRKKNRKREMVYYRYVAMYLLREKGYIIATIGRFLNRHHSDVIHACKQVDDAIAGYNKQLLRVYELAKEVHVDRRILCKPVTFQLKKLRVRQ